MITCSYRKKIVTTYNKEGPRDGYCNCESLIFTAFRFARLGTCKPPMQKCPALLMKSRLSGNTYFWGCVVSQLHMCCLVLTWKSEIGTISVPPTKYIFCFLFFFSWYDATMTIGIKKKKDPMQLANPILLIYFLI
jgi:hypothetical protein